MAAARAWLRTHPLLATVVLAGVVTRAVLVPIIHGPDFTVWDLASRATLAGVNVYAHHPAYSGGPYSYPPLFLYLELPMQWLAQRTGVPFSILGKLPIVGGDLVVTWAIVRELERRGASARAVAAGAALFFLNPLVLYNGAFYGRFDSVCLAVLMLAFVAHRRGRAVGWRTSAVYALSIAVKIFPVFLLPWLVRRSRASAVRVLAAGAVVLFAVCAPYLVTSPGPFVTDLLYSAGHLPGGLSWQVVLHGLPAAVQVDTGDALLAVFAVAAIGLAALDDLTLFAAATLVLFLLLSKQVIEQYLLWPLPFVVLLAAGQRSRAAWLLAAELTVAGMLVNAHFHPFGVQPAAFNVVWALLVAATLAGLLARRDGGAVRERWPGARRAPSRVVAGSAE